MGEPPPTPREGTLITDSLRASGLSARKAAREAGISEGWWRQIVRGYQTLSGGGYGVVRGPAPTVARMARVVGVTPEQLAEAGREDAAQELREMAGAAGDVPAEEVLRRLGDDPWVRDALDRLPPDLQRRALEDIADIHERVRHDTRRYLRALLQATQGPESG